MSLRTRFAMLTSLLVLLVVTAVSVGAYYVSAQQLRSEVDRSLTQRMRQIRDALVEAERLIPGERQRNPVAESFMQTEFDAITQLVDANGVILASYGRVDIPITQRDLRMARGGTDYYRTTVKIERRTYRVYTMSFPEGGLLQVAKDTQEIESAKDGMRFWFIVIGAIGFAFAAFVGWLFARRVTKPIEQLADTADTVAKTQNLAQRISVDGDAEVAQLAGSFNTMLSALSDSVSKQRQLIQDASHELRTPLTSLRANTELLQRPGLTEEDRASILDDMRKEVDELAELSHELSELASDQRSLENPVVIDLSELAEDVAERARRRTTGNIIVHVSGDVTVVARQHQLERAITNLVDNAIKFSPDSSEIEIRVCDKKIEVRDHGPGIPDSDKPHVFDRFYRSTTTRSMPGSGLGLAIVRQCADDNFATIYIEDAPGGGTVIGLSF
jgi:two-component system, OmpR family, sensor histidine kinase MprB